MSAAREANSCSIQEGPDLSERTVDDPLRASEIARRRTEEERAEAFFPLRATTTAADSKRDARAAEQVAWRALVSVLRRARDAHRRRNRDRGPLARTLTAAVCALAGLMIIISALHAQGTDLRPARNTDLVSLVQVPIASQHRTDSPADCAAPGSRRARCSRQRAVRPRPRTWQAGPPRRPDAGHWAGGYGHPR